MKTTFAIRRFAFTALALLAAGCAGTGSPKAESQGAPMSFRAMDANHDGKVSREEFSNAAKTSAFHQLDADQSQFITLDEWMKHAETPDARKHFESLDANKDGKLSKAEFLALPNKETDIDEQFAQLDKIKDNFILPEEQPSRKNDITVMYKFFSRKF
ncbi:MAG: EF-hand domain-containing protein [Verrucomicrobiae bacterium]|nr:EF-hand domain-containing protein [Verrucomicrobiae bacterium]